MASEQDVESEPMARAVSAADVEKALAGIDFPKSRDEIVDYAGERLPPDSPIVPISVPSTAETMTITPGSPARANAMKRPSGDQVGSCSTAELFESRC